MSSHSARVQSDCGCLSQDDRRRLSITVQIL